jgi:hypothetical protein
MIHNWTHIIWICFSITIEFVSPLCSWKKILLSRRVSTIQNNLRTCYVLRWSSGSIIQSRDRDQEHTDRRRDNLSDWQFDGSLGTEQLGIEVPTAMHLAGVNSRTGIWAGATEQLAHRASLLRGEHKIEQVQAQVDGAARIGGWRPGSAATPLATGRPGPRSTATLALL